MKTYRVRFYAVLKGSLGVKAWHTTYVKALDENKAVLSLYDTFDHITFPIVAEVTISKLVKGEKNVCYS